MRLLPQRAPDTDLVVYLDAFPVFCDFLHVDLHTLTEILLPTDPLWAEPSPQAAPKPPASECWPDHLPSLSPSLSLLLTSVGETAGASPPSSPPPGPLPLLTSAGASPPSSPLLGLAGVKAPSRHAVGGGGCGAELTPQASLPPGPIPATRQAPWSATPSPKPRKCLPLHLKQNYPDFLSASLKYRLQVTGWRVPLTPGRCPSARGAGEARSGCCELRPERSLCGRTSSLLLLPAEADIVL